MLFAVLLSRQSDGLEPAARDRRLRTLRNLAESAFIDRKRMSEYVGTVERLMLQGTLENAQGFNAEWTADESEKWKVVDAHPEVVPALHKLEDLPVIRGRLFAFELDAETLGDRGRTYSSSWQTHRFEIHSARRSSPRRTTRAMSAGTGHAGSSEAHQGRLLARPLHNR